MVRKKTLDQLNRESFEYLARETPVTNLAPGGVARSLVESTNRQIADRMNVSTRTIEARRHNVFQKTEASSIADLVKLTLSFRQLEAKRS